MIQPLGPIKIGISLVSVSRVELWLVLSWDGLLLLAGLVLILLLFCELRALEVIELACY
jgi:hypothetical protein